MGKKLLAFLLVVGVASTATAANIETNTNANGAWTDVATWDQTTGTGYAGENDPNDRAYINNGSTVSFSAGENVTLARANVGGFPDAAAAATPGVLNMSGGNLETFSKFRISEENDGTMNMSGGFLEADDKGIVLGTKNNTGILNMSGGEIFAKKLKIGEAENFMGNDVQGIGKIFLSGGQITLWDPDYEDAFFVEEDMNNPGNFAPGTLIDITGSGRISIVRELGDDDPDDYSAVAQSLIDAGMLISSNPNTSVGISVEVVDDPFGGGGMDTHTLTHLTAVPEPATFGLMGVGLCGMLLRRNSLRRSA